MPQQLGECLAFDRLGRHLGLLAREMGGRIDDEARAYEEALALDGDLGEAQLALGALLADPTTPERLRDPAKARTLLSRFLDQSVETDGEGRRQALAWLRWLEANAS